LKRIRDAGHTIGNHSQNHPLAFEKMPLHLVQAEIEQGFSSIATALGERRPPSPFFRIPGLLRAKEVENHLQSRGLTTWSADVVADDWKHINAAEVVRRRSRAWKKKAKAFCCCTTSSRRPCSRSPSCFASSKSKATALCTWCRVARRSATSRSLRCRRPSRWRLRP